MATRTDINVDFSVSPRRIVMDAPSLSITMQDLVDTLREIEDDLPLGMSNPRLLDASGKEPLGGGVSVGITVALQNAVFEAEARNVAAESGTHTGSTSTTQLIDSAADFVAAGVERGSLIINFTDQSIVDVLEVVDANTLNIRGSLTGGTDNDFDNGDAYKVYNHVQVQVFGGNMTSVDDLGADIDPISPSAFVQVVRTSSSSATITDLDEVIGALRIGSFNDEIHVDGVNGSPLVTSAQESFPLGTESDPVSNLADARTLADFYGIKGFHIERGNFSLDQDYEYWEFRGNLDATNSIITLNGMSIDGSGFVSLTITGTGTGAAGMRECVVNGTTGISLAVKDTYFSGTTTIPSGGFCTVIQGGSVVAGTGTPIISYGATGGTMQFRGWSGGLELQGSDEAGQNCSVDLLSGRLVIGATNTAGVIVVRGCGHKDDSAAGAVTIVDLGLVDAEQLQAARKVLTNTLVTNPADGTLTVLDDDDATTFLSGLMYEDVAQTQLYRGQGAQVRRRLT